MTNPTPTKDRHRASDGPPRKRGRALLLTKAGKRFVATVVIEDRLIHCTEVFERHGMLDAVWHSPRADRVWISNELSEIRWLAEAETWAE